MVKQIHIYSFNVHRLFFSDLLCTYLKLWEPLVKYVKLEVYCKRLTDSGLNTYSFGDEAYHDSNRDSINENLKNDDKTGFKKLNNTRKPKSFVRLFLTYLLSFNFY